MKPAPGPLGKLDSLWDDRVYLETRKVRGRRERSGGSPLKIGGPAVHPNVWSESLGERLTEDPEVDGQRCEITKLDQPQKESVQSEWSRPVPRYVYIFQERSRDAPMFEWMRRVSLHIGWWVQAGSQSRVSSKDGGTSQRHGPIREDTAEVEKAKIASDAKRVRKMESEEMTGDLPANAGSSKEIMGNPHDNAASSSTATTSSSSEMDTTERRRNPVEGRCDLEPKIETCEGGR